MNPTTTITSNQTKSNTVIPKRYIHKILNEYLGINKYISFKIAFGLNLTGEELKTIDCILRLSKNDLYRILMDVGEVYFHPRYRIKYIDLFSKLRINVNFRWISHKNNNFYIGHSPIKDDEI